MHHSSSQQSSSNQSHASNSFSLNVFSGYLDETAYNGTNISTHTKLSISDTEYWSEKQSLKENCKDNVTFNKITLDDQKYTIK